MSYTTTIWIYDLGETEIDMFAIEEAYFKAAEPMKLNDLPGWMFEAFCGIADQDGPYPMMRSYFESVFDLCVLIADLAPQCSFGVRAMGEEFDDFWLAVFTGGKVNHLMSARGKISPTA
jgi:hypothetical protein